MVLHPKKTLDYKRLGLLQGLAAGLMISLSFFDLIPESVESLGLGETQLWFFIGTLIFVAVSTLVPEASVESLVTPAAVDAAQDHEGDKVEAKGGEAASPAGGTRTKFAKFPHNFPSGFFLLFPLKTF